MYVKKAGYDSCANFIHMAHGRDQWWFFVSILMNFGVPQKIKYILSSVASISCSMILTP
jgi:hypothetical protein